MKHSREILVSILLGMVLPMLLLRTIRSDIKQTEVIYVKVLTEDGVHEMDVEEYLVGVLLREMPGCFEFEALRAQAVAARTFTLFNKEKGAKHEEADVCVISNCCQGYMSPKGFIDNGGAAAVLVKMYGAVKSTSSEVLYYENSLIEATYFSSSGGRTEDAKAVWGADIPYLQSVASEESNSSSKSVFTITEFCVALGLPVSDVSIGEPVYTNGFGIAEIDINGTVFTGIQLRRYLNLRSTVIAFDVDEEKVGVITCGYGHRVGMSQYGADAMAKRGRDYKQILKHYYSGVEIGIYTP